MPHQSAICTLPNELLDKIFVHLTDKIDWLSLCRTHRSFVASAQRLLFRDVHLPAQYLAKPSLIRRGLQALYRTAISTVQQPFMERLYRPPCSLPEFGEEFEPDLTRRCAKFANAITTSPHLAQNVDAIRFDVVIVPDLFMGTMVLEEEIIAKLLAKLTRL
jgi:hypothetical protein